MSEEEWKFYFPEDGQTADQAIECLKVHSAEQTALEAMDYDYYSRDGHLRDVLEYDITVISPEGEETHWVGTIDFAPSFDVSECR